MAGAGSVAVDGLAVRGDGGDGAVGVGHDRPAEAVDEVVMVGEAEQPEIPQRGLAALAAGHQVVGFAVAGGAVAAGGPLAVPVAEVDGAAQVAGDVAGGAD